MTSFGFVINGLLVTLPGVDIHNWHTNPRLRLAPSDRRPRKTGWVRSIFNHSTKGLPVKVQPGFGPDVDDGQHVADFWSLSGLQSGAHIVIGRNGKVYCLADLATEVAFHAESVNEVSVGIEIYQEADGTMYQGQLEIAADVNLFLCRRFGIQPQFHSPYLGDSRAARRLAEGGKDCVGIFGHRDQTTDRGRGDPGDPLFDVLRRRGAESFDFSVNADIVRWKFRQGLINQRLRAHNAPLLVEDGIPGPATFQAIKTYFHRDGLWLAVA